MDGGRASCTFSKVFNLTVFLGTTAIIIIFIIIVVVSVEFYLHFYCQQMGKNCSVFI